MTEQQPYLGKDYEPPSNPDIERAIDAWYVAKREQRLAAQSTRDAHGVMVLHMQNAGIDTYPWTNPDTGKKRNIVIGREPKAKEARASSRSPKRDVDADLDPAEKKAKKREAKRRREEEKVEVRRVPRSTVEDDIDPFAATRNAMDSSSTTKPDKPSAKKKGKRK